MKILSRLFRPAPPPAPVAPAIEPPTAAVAPPPPPPPVVDPDEHAQLLDSIASGALTPDELMRIAVEGPTTRVRQAAAGAIQDPQCWQQLLPRLRGRDKAAYKLVKQRHDAMLSAERAAVTARAEADALCAAIDKHSCRPHDPLYEPTLATLIERWRALPDSVDAALRQRAGQALAQCEAVVAAAHAAQQARRLAAIEAAEQAAAARTAAEEQLARQQAERIELEQAAAAEDAADNAAQMDEPPDSVEADGSIDTGTDARREIASLIRLGGAALQRGDTRKAARFRQSIEAALPAAGDLPPHLLRNLEHLDARLNELRQWKDYVAAPKRIELIEEMEALIGVDEAPQQLAEHIRALRQEWRTINKGLAVEATAESERFEQAFHKAFQPCQAYFTEQAAVRRANLDARRQVLERLVAFEAELPADECGLPVDHGRIQHVLRAALQEFRTHAPVDRDAARPVDADFYRALDRLRARVSAWHARNLTDKQALIDRARALGEAADLSRALDEVRQLQARWKATGPVPHPQSQALWDEFRALCNAVFDRRRQATAELQAGLAAAKTQAEALCADIEQAAAQGPTDRPTGEARLRGWQDAFDAIGELPRADARALRERFRRAMSGYGTLIDALSRRDADAAERNALDAARHVRAYQRAIIDVAAETDCTRLRDAALEFIASVPRWPHKSLPQTLRQALARADSEEFRIPDDAMRERALRELCIRAEILAGVATPTEDAALRRDIELGLLRNGLGQARRMDERDWEMMRTEWFGLAAVPPALHEALEQRFVDCLRQRAR
ncbi:MAG: DUF349 domain-containing protein [Steroidobacteraceae bacterium]